MGLFSITVKRGTWVWWYEQDSKKYDAYGHVDLREAPVTLGNLSLSGSYCWVF